MDRLQKKCVLASALLHGALLASVVVVSAFTPAPSEPKQTVMFAVPINSRDLATVPTGPTMTEVPAAPIEPPPPPPPPPQPVKDTVVPKDVFKAPEKIEPLPPKKISPPKPDGLVPPKTETKNKSKPKDEPKKADTKKIEKTTPKKEDTAKKNEKTIKLADTTHLSTRKPPDETDPNSKDHESEAKKRAAQYAKAQADWQKKIGGAFSGLRSNVSGPISFSIPGAGAGAFQNYGQQIVAIYERSWFPPAEVADENAVVQVVVTISRDGRVVDARVVRPSGTAPVDRSVRETLKNVRLFPPFPPGADDEQRTFNIDFNLKAKRSLG
ncbi:MAG: TonB family protein [Verrucomicrobia bacterium]|nr:TonB family protein [Verrucomicrobiota bacterium]